jgi:hypothetical protein
MEAYRAAPITPSFEGVEVPAGVDTRPTLKALIGPLKVHPTQRPFEDEE